MFCVLDIVDSEEKVLSAMIRLKAKLPEPVAASSDEPFHQSQYQQAGKNLVWQEPSPQKPTLVFVGLTSIKNP